jgi:predicted dehydrogenase
MTGEVGIGLVGSGFMGKAHSLAFRMVGGVFQLKLRPRLELIADISEEIASSAAVELGFSGWTTDWRRLVGDKRVHVVDITTPNALHKPIALAAAVAQKHVYCEKPLAATAADAWEMVEAAERAGVKTQVGFNYLKNPIIRLARDIIDNGEIGRLISFRGIHAEDYMADASSPWMWRHDPAGGAGVVSDLGSHIIAMARYLIGRITEVCAQADTIVRERPAGFGGPDTRQVEVPDTAQALVKFENGCQGSLEASWVSMGRKMQLEFEIVGTKGAIGFSQERFSELCLYTTGAHTSRDGFRTILAGPDHPPYSAFCPAAGHQLGFNDLKTIEVRDFLLAIAGEASGGPDFREGWEVQKVVDAIVTSADERRWVSVL